MKMWQLWKQLTCTHYWQERNTTPCSMNHAIWNLYGDFVKCDHCGKLAWLSRKVFIDHLIETKRMAQ